MGFGWTNAVKGVAKAPIGSEMNPQRVPLLRRTPLNQHRILLVRSLGIWMETSSLRWFDTF